MATYIESVLKELPSDMLLKRMSVGTVMPVSRWLEVLKDTPFTKQPRYFSATVMNSETNKENTTVYETDFMDPLNAKKHVKVFQQVEKDDVLDIRPMLEQLDLCVQHLQENDVLMIKVPESVPAEAIQKIVRQLERQLEESGVHKVCVLVGYKNNSFDIDHLPSMKRLLALEEEMKTLKARLDSKE